MFNSIRSRLLFTYFLLIAAILAVVTLALLVFLIRNPRLAREAEINLTSAANALQRQPLSIITEIGFGIFSAECNLPERAKMVFAGDGRNFTRCCGR